MEEAGGEEHEAVEELGIGVFFLSFCFSSFTGIMNLVCFSFSFFFFLVVLSGGSGEKEMFVKPPT